MVSNITVVDINKKATISPVLLDKNNSQITWPEALAQYQAKAYWSDIDNAKPYGLFVIDSDGYATFIPNAKGSFNVKCEVHYVDTNNKPRTFIANLKIVVIVNIKEDTSSSGSGSSPDPSTQNGTYFEWHQTIALAVWTIPHNLNRYPSVTCVDDVNDVVFVDITYTDKNIVQIKHSKPMTGYVYFN